MCYSTIGNKAWSMLPNPVTTDLNIPFILLVNVIGYLKIAVHILSSWPVKSTMEVIMNVIMNCYE